VLRHHTGGLAVGVADPATDAAATYQGGQRFDTASIVKADILAVLLLQHQQLGTWLSPGDRDLAAAMIDDSDNAAATALWDAAEGAPGMLAGEAGQAGQERDLAAQQVGEPTAWRAGCRTSGCRP
jgi:hypothetical protein